MSTCPNARSKSLGFFKGNEHSCSCNGKKIDKEYYWAVCDKVDNGANTYKNCNVYKMYGIRNSQ